MGNDARPLCQGPPQFQYRRGEEVCGNQGNAGGYEKARDGIRRTEGIAGGTPSFNIADCGSGVVTPKRQAGTRKREKHLSHRPHTRGDPQFQYCQFRRRHHNRETASGSLKTRSGVGTRTPFPAVLGSSLGKKGLQGETEITRPSAATCLSTSETGLTSRHVHRAHRYPSLPPASRGTIPRSNP